MKKAKYLLSFILVFAIVIGSFTLSAFAADVNEVEDNNTKENATAFTYDVAAVGALADKDDVDFYNVSSAKNGLATVKLVSNSSDDFTVTVFAEDGTTQLTSFVASSTNTTSTQFGVAEGFVYYIKVSAGSQVSGVNYTLTFNVTEYKYSEKEDNNTESAANEIAIKASSNESEEYFGSVTAGDVDFFKFQGKNSSYFFIDFKNTDTSNASLNLEVYAVVGTETKKIAATDVTASAKSVSTANVGIKNATYFIKVFGADSSQTGAYTVKVTLKSTTKALETEYNNTEDFCNTISLTGAKANSILMIGSTSYQDDVDIYKLDVTTSDKKYVIALNVDTTEDKDNPDARINKDGNFTVSLKDGDTKTATSTAPAEFEITEPGTYYFTVKKGVTYTEGLYYFTLKSVEDYKKETKINDFQSFINAIKALDWGAFWNENSFGQLIDIIRGSGVIKELLRLSFGTIITWITGSAS